MNFAVGDRVVITDGDDFTGREGIVIFIPGETYVADINTLVVAHYYEVLIPGEKDPAFEQDTFAVAAGQVALLWD